MYHNINFDRVVKLYYFMIKDLSIVAKIRHLVKCLILATVTEYSISNYSGNYDFIFFNTTQRKDHKFLFETIYNVCNRSKVILNVKICLSFNIKNIFFFIKNINIMKLMDKNYSNFEKFIIYLKITIISDFVRKIEKIECKNLVVYSDLKPCEDLIIRVQNMKGANTISLQHALFIEYNSLPNINMLNYIDIPSRYLLSWGESTKKLVCKYNSNITVVICGKPIKTQEQIRIKDYKRISVVFDQPMFREHNEKMIAIAYKYAKKNNMKVILRKHPLDSFENYKIDYNITDLKARVEDSNFIIAHTTSMIYEYMSLGYRVYKLKSNIPCNVISSEIQFDSFNDLESIVLKNFDFVKESKNYIKYIGEDSIDKYRTFFNKL